MLALSGLAPGGYDPFFAFGAAAQLVCLAVSIGAIATLASRRDSLATIGVLQ